MKDAFIKGRGWVPGAECAVYLLDTSRFLEVTG